jgi:hypothetical protein
MTRASHRRSDRPAPREHFTWVIPAVSLVEESYDEAKRRVAEREAAKEAAERAGAPQDAG